LKKYILLSPAKINLWLRITGKRDDGYHTLNSLVQKISLFDIIKVSEHYCDTVKFYNEKIDSPNNTVSKALMLFKEKGCVKKKFKIEVFKNIPTEAGLGGGSSNAGIVLNFLNRYVGNRFTLKELIKLGSFVGADVPLFISGYNRILMKGIGEILSPHKNTEYNYWVLLIKPHISIPTSWAYKKLNFKLTNKFKSINKRLAEHSEFVNDLEKPVIEKHKEIGEIKETLITLGCKHSLMSGSGSVVYGLFENKKVAIDAKSFFKNNYNSYKTFLAKFL
jgi:4-diphosphocytidyl-2-C-methyl-D-erythritol kinase